MSKVIMTIELEYEARLMYGDSKADKDWFFNDVLKGPYLMLADNELIGDDIGRVKVLELQPPKDTDE